MADWQTVSSLATAGGTLVLAIATFSAVRSSNRSARVAEQALLAGLRAVLVPSLAGDPDQKAVWSDRHVAKVSGGRAIAETENDVVYLAIGLRNVGSGLALIHGWYAWPFFARQETEPVAPEAFRRQGLDLYIAPGGSGYWESAFREPGEQTHADFVRVITEREPFAVDLLYGDQDGGQRTISRCLVFPANDGGWYSQIARHWNVDRPDPR